MVGLLVFTLLSAAAWLIVRGDRPRFAELMPNGSIPGDVASGGGASGGGRAALARTKRKARNTDHLDDLPLLIHELATLLEAGRNPTRLWQDAARVCQSRASDQPEALWGEFAEIFAACARNAQLGFSASHVLTRDVEETRVPPLVQQSLKKLGVCVLVSEESGAPLTSMLRRFAEQVEDDIDADLSRKAILAGPRATAKLLAWLPLFGLLLGWLAGADVTSIFLGSLWGTALLCVGIALMVVGKVWADRLVRLAEVPTP